MIRPAKDRKRRAKAAKARKLTPKPEWVEAFMVLLLAKAGGKVGLHIDILEKYCGMEGGNPTKLEYDEDTKIVTISLPIEKKSEIVVPKARLII